MTVHVCEQCSAPFDRAGDRPYRYCGRACYYASRIGRQTPEAVLLNRECRQCGESFQSKSSAGARINYCSRWCQSLAMTGANSTVRDLTVAEAAYLAALIDGEGTVMVIDRRRQRPGSSHPSVTLSVAGSHKPMHEWLVKTVGAGTLTKYRRDPEGPIKSVKQVYAWRVQAATAVAVLRQTLPYMIEKAERSALAVRSFEEGYAALDERSVG